MGPEHHGPAGAGTEHRFPHLRWQHYHGVGIVAELGKRTSLRQRFRAKTLPKAEHQRKGSGASWPAGPMTPSPVGDRQGPQGLCRAVSFKRPEPGPGLALAASCERL